MGENELIFSGENYETTYGNNVLRVESLKKQDSDFRYRHILETLQVEFQTPARKQILKLNKSHKIFDFPVLIKFLFIQSVV